MSGDISHVSQETSPTLTDLSTDFTSTNATLPKLYHITEPWDDPSAPTSEQATPRSLIGAQVEHSTPGQTLNQPLQDHGTNDNASPSLSSTAVSPSQIGNADRDYQQSPGGVSTQSGSSVDKIIREANILVSEINEKTDTEVADNSKETSNNTTYRELPTTSVVGATGDVGHGDPTTNLADREVEFLNADSVASKGPSSKKTPSDTAEDDMDADIANKVKNLMSETGWRDRRLKSFDYAALKQDLEDIENRLQRARNSTNASLWPDQQRKAQSLQYLTGPPHSPVERNQSPDTLTSSGKASSLAELDRSRRLKWDYAADIASGPDPATPIAGLGGSGEFSGSGELRMRMSMSQASFVSSPDPEDSALEAALKSRDVAAMKDSKTTDSLSARMEEILSHEDPQSHVAAILQQADEAERRLRARLRKAPNDAPVERESYLDALRSAHRDTLSPGNEDEHAWNRLNLSAGASGPTSFRTPGVGGLPGAIDSSRSDATTSGGEQISGSGRLGASARSTTTAESTHPGSDDAMGPNFPDSVYGSRVDPYHNMRGIYHKPKNRDSKGVPQFKSPGMPQRSRTGPHPAVDEVSHRSRPPASPSAGFGDVHKSLETISSHDTCASTTVPMHTPDHVADDPNSLEEYASKLRNKWERYQRLLGQGQAGEGRPTTPRELQELLSNPGRYIAPRGLGRDIRAHRDLLTPKKSAGSDRSIPEAWVREVEPRVRSGRPEGRQAPGGRGERVCTAGNGPSRHQGGSGGRSRGVQTPASGTRGVRRSAGAGDDGSEDSGPEEWRQRIGGRHAIGVGDVESGDEETEATDSQDTLNLMTRMAGLLRNGYDDEDEGERSLGLTEDDPVSDGTMSELDPQLLRLKHLFLKQKEKWLWERARETTRRHKIQKLQRLIAERVRRHRSVDIDESLDTETLSSSILSDLEDTTAQDGSGRRRHERQRRASEGSSADTLTAESTPRAKHSRGRQTVATAPAKSPKAPAEKRTKEATSRRTKFPIMKTKADRRIQVYPPGQTWEIPAPGRDPRSANKENRFPLGGTRKEQSAGGIRRAKPNTAFVEKMSEVSSRDHNGLQARGSGLAWYHPVSERRSSSRITDEDSTMKDPGTSRSGRHAEIGVQGDNTGPSLEVPSDGIDLQVKLAQPLLSEAFEGCMGDFISRSRERQKRVRLAAEERRYVSQMEAERVKLFAGDEAGGALRRRPRTQPDPLSENLHQPRHRAFSRKEMREQNRRMCRALPEVQQRAIEEKRKAQTRSNIIRRQLYGEKVLRSVLRKRGPWVLAF